ncbi:MAG: hypothetical protein ACLFQX_05780 [Candidatus Kapaibacterium sp.]
MLNLLNRKEKEAFLELAAHIAESDKGLNPQERQMLMDFQKDMGIEDYKIKSLGFDEILESLDDCSFVGKTSMLLNLLSVTTADEEYSHDEQRHIHTLRKRWGVTDEQFVAIVHWLKNRNKILKAEGFKI